MSSQHKPKVVELTRDDVISLKNKISDTNWGDNEKKLVVGILEFNLWLQDQLQNARLTIFKLKKIFGLPTEKKRIKK